MAPAGRKEKTNASHVVQKYIASRGVVQGRLGVDAKVSTRVDSRRENAGQNVRYQREITDVYLLFDGKTLSIKNTEDNAILRRFPAVSGRKENGRFDYSRERQKMVSAGPLPEGEYYVSMNELQKITLWDDAVGSIGALAKQSWGSWPKGRMAWGSQRAWLKPEEVMIDGVKRDKFSIHGGASFGSAGCIDLRENASAFFNALDYYLQNIPSKKVKLIVKYR